MLLLSFMFMLCNCFDVAVDDEAVDYDDAFVYDDLADNVLRC